MLENVAVDSRAKLTNEPLLDAYFRSEAHLGSCQSCTYDGAFYENSGV